ncbi:MAG: hypothetical protein GY953_32425 [bacterium]|nr:hypothetical protein [bacterium]
MWVDHNDDSGAVTFFPLDDLRRETGETFRGVLLTDIFEAPPPPHEPHPYSAPVITIE